MKGKQKADIPERFRGENHIKASQEKKHRKEYWKNMVNMIPKKQGLVRIFVSLKSILIHILNKGRVFLWRFIC